MMSDDWSVLSEQSVGFGRSSAVFERPSTLIRKENSMYDLKDSFHALADLRLYARPLRTRKS